ncbi:MAG: iron-sulfur cluster repair di-iron protein [Bacteroidetes bacterium]|nr:iron-sulfur cluster repair di-iron protein [Bacteroidota bacterium]
MTTLNKTIGEMVAEDFRTAAVFKKFGIDFCCKGNRSIEEACEPKNINPKDIYAAIENMNATQESSGDFNSWPLDLLADYVEKVHHSYVAEKTPVLLQFLNKVSRVHGDRHPELIEIYQLFEDSAQDLAAHMKKEELILFPFIKKMMHAEKNNLELDNPHFGTVENPVAMMKHDHEMEGERFRQIAELSDNYQFPEDACNTYRVTYQMLEEFENDLHKHIHLENNILFPKAVELEKKLRNN